MNERKNKVLISGGTGMVGSYLTKILLQKGYAISILTRSKIKSKNRNIQYFEWNINEEWIDEKAFENCQYIINLAGANIGDKRWTNKYKQELYISRIHSSQLLMNTFQRINTPIKAIISASSVGFYGNTNHQITNENNEAGGDFLAQLCKEWEEIILSDVNSNIRKVIIRTGIVFSDKGGALPKMITPIQYFMGAPLGNGLQNISWIHIHDLCKMYLFALENESINGIYNGVSSQIVSNRELNQTIAKILQRPLWSFGIPKSILSFLIGEVAEYAYKDSTISAEKILKSGYTFDFPNLEQAIENCLTKKITE